MLRRGVFAVVISLVLEARRLSETAPPSYRLYGLTWLIVSFDSYNPHHWHPVDKDES